MKVLHIRVSDELKERIVAIAEKKSRSVNYVANEALAHYAKKFKENKNG